MTETRAQFLARVVRIARLEITGERPGPLACGCCGDELGPWVAWGADRLACVHCARDALQLEALEFRVVARPRPRVQ